MGNVVHERQGFFTTLSLLTDVRPDLCGFYYLCYSFLLTFSHR